MGDFLDFAWACGEEASDPLVFFDGSMVRVDELAASGHLERQDQDLAAVAALGVTVWRYGMPWRLVEPAPRRYDWAIWDRALEACAAHGLEPVVDLCHFGLPEHYGGFCQPDWVDGFVRYVEAFLARYPGPRWFTPVNEPFVTAWYSAGLGAWNDRRASRDDFAQALANVTLANLEANTRIRADRDGWWIGAEGFSCPIAIGPEQEGKTARIEARAWAVWDLHFGHDLSPLIASEFDAVSTTVRDRINSLASTEQMIAGHDLYPTSVFPVGPPPEAWTIADRLDGYETSARRWHARYGVDFWIAETSNLGLGVDQQIHWLDAFADRLGSMRDAGLPARGLCWYSRGDQYDWHSALTRPVGEITQVGLFTSDRQARPIAARFAEHAQRGAPPTQPNASAAPRSAAAIDPQPDRYSSDAGLEGQPSNRDLRA